MTSLTILLLAVSLAVLLLGAYLWRLTSSRSIFINAVVGSVAMLLAANYSAMHRQMEMAVILPFLTTMLFGGRAMGIWWRSRKETDLRLPARLMMAVTALALTATISAYVAP